MNKTIYNEENQKCTVSTVNSTSSPLLASTIFTGAWENILNYASISVISNSDQIATLYVEFSTDGFDTARTLQLSEGLVHLADIHTVIPVANYMRVRVVNGGTDQGSLIVQTIFSSESRIALPTSRVNQDIGHYTDVLNTRAVLTGLCENEMYGNVSITLGNELKVSTAVNFEREFKPFARGELTNDILNNQLWRYDVDGISASTSAITVANRKVDMVLGAPYPGFGFSVITFLKIIKSGDYFCHFKIKFTNSFSLFGGQIVGLVNLGNGIYIGYPNLFATSTFGINVFGSGKVEKVQLIITAAATGTETAVLTLDSVAFDISLTNAGGVLEFTAHEINHGAIWANFNWNAQHIGDYVFFTNYLPTALTGGTYSFVSATATATISVLESGLDYTSDNVPRADFNGSSIIKDTFDPFEWQEYYIRKRNHDFFLEFGIYNSAQGHYEILHEYIPSQTDLMFEDPDMFMTASNNGLGFSPSTMQVSEMYADIRESGIETTIKATYSYSLERTITANVETPIFTISSRLLFGLRDNTVESILDLLTVSTDGTKSVSFRIVKNIELSPIATTTDFDNFTYIDEANSSVLVDITADTVDSATGDSLLTFVEGKLSSSKIDLTPFLISMARQETITITALSTNTNTVAASLLWEEAI